MAVLACPAVVVVAEIVRASLRNEFASKDCVSGVGAALARQPTIGRVTDPALAIHLQQYSRSESVCNSGVHPLAEGPAPGVGFGQQTVRLAPQA
eukprot:scaffold293572_cov30-Tisochrysis_lutea.AAC.3